MQIKMETFRDFSRREKTPRKTAREMRIVFNFVIAFIIDKFLPCIEGFI